MRISGITIPENKRLSYGLRILYGVGHSRALRILSGAKVLPEKKARENISRLQTLPSRLMTSA